MIERIQYFVVVPSLGLPFPTGTGAAGLVPPEKNPVRVFLMEVRNQTISCSRPIRAAHREEPATPPPPPEGKEIPLCKRSTKFR